MKRLTWVLVLVLSVAVFADTIKSVSPNNGEVVSPLAATMKLFLMMPEDAARAALKDATLASRLCNEVKSFAPGIPMQWAFQGERSKIHYELHVAENSHFRDEKVIQAPHSRYNLCNLEIGKTYYWKVAAVYQDGTSIESETRSFTVDPLTPRVLNVPNVDNFRDLGGRRGLEGRLIPQGLIFRCSGFNNNSSDGGKTPGSPRFTEEGLRIIREELKIKTDLDLRSHGETARMTTSPLGEDVNFVNNSTVCYAPTFTNSGLEVMAKNFRVFTKPENYPIAFHCIAGADRTGSLAVLLEALLGVERDEIMRDYVLTSFFCTRPHANGDILLNGLERFGKPEEPLSVKAERYFLEAGITPEEIIAFRTIVLGPGLQPSPVLQEKMTMDQIFADFPGEAKIVRPVPYFTFSEQMTLAGKEMTFGLPTWGESPVQKALGNDVGGAAFLLSNRTGRMEFLGLRPRSAMTDADYAIYNPMTKVAYAKADGSPAWRRDDFAQFKMVLPVGDPLVLVVVPGDVPADCTVAPLPELPEAPVNYLTALSGEAPVLDGKLDDAIWQLEAPLKLNDTEGNPKKSAPAVWLRTDAAHDTLYIAVRLPDTTPNGSRRNQRDASIWEEDEVEIFLAASGHSTYYQFVFNRFNDFFDGKKTDASWNVEEWQSAVSQDDEGWTVEAAFPLAQFNFDAPLEINICTTDQPGEAHYNLFTTNGSFHNRAVMGVVLLK
ncbi:MAG: tyrosine-protein phosphatase [Victivallales bacterium]|nr:tyrosine-protein phosphatase [Victivallales bacterium]